MKTERAFQALYCSALLIPSLVFAAAQDGRDGRSHTVFADGSAMVLDASGTDGYDGRDGRDGSDAIGCTSGSDGENGEDGGDGGNAGLITVAYHDISLLKAIAVYQQVGYGGSGGRGGRGGRGATCEYKDKDGNIRYETFPDGNYGQSGSSGSRGYNNGIRLVPNLQSLPAETPAMTVPFSRLASMQSFTLSKNFWDRVPSGASLLFSPSSRMVGDSYSVYTGRSETQATVIWASPREVAGFTDVGFSLSYDGSQVGFSAGYDTWMDFSRAGDQIQIKNVLRASEVEDIELGAFTGSGKAIHLSVNDKALVTQYLTDQVTIEYRTMNFIGQRVSRYTGPVPAGALVARADGSGYDIAVGSLPIGSAHLKSGTSVQIKLHLNRSAYGKSMKVSLDRVYKVQ